MYDFLNLPYFIQAQINKELLGLLIENILAKESMFWISNGSIKAIEATWNLKTNFLYQDTDNSLNNLPLQAQAAIIMSKNTDCTMLFTSNNRHGLNFIAKGKLLENLSASQAQILIKQYTAASTIGKMSHETQPIQNS